MSLHFLSRIFRRSEPAYAGPVIGIPVIRSGPPALVFPTALRPQHLGIIGLSGSGKSYLLEHLIRQDIQHNIGFVLFDVHGDLADNIIAYLAERAPSQPDIYERTVILEPFDTDRSFGFNPLEIRDGVPAHVQSQEFAHILRTRWYDERFTPRMEQLLRNTLWTLAAGGRTLADFPMVLTNRRFRAELASRINDSGIQGYWAERYDRLSSKMQAVIREPILTRISGFLEDPYVRDIVGQVKSTFSFVTAAERGQWIIINLSKGQLGSNSALLGSMLFAKLELDVMSLARLPRHGRKLFVVYADELQNLAGSTFNRLVAEARKYRVGIVAGHQFWNQLEPHLRDAMLGVGSKAFFRLHYHDAVELAGELAADERQRYIRILTSLGRGEAVVRIGTNRPTLVTIPSHRPPKPSQTELETLRKASDERHTRPRAFVRQEIEEGTPAALLSSRGNEALSD